MRIKIIGAIVVVCVCYAITVQAGQTMNLSSMLKLAQATPEEAAPPTIEESTIPLPPPPPAAPSTPSTVSSAAAPATTAASSSASSATRSATATTATPAASRAAPAPANTAKTSYAEGQSCYDKLKSDPAAKKDRARWLQCVNDFAAVSASGSADAAKATYSTARLSREMYGATHSKEDMSRALEYYNTVVNDYADSSLADDALLAIAQVRVGQGDRVRATKALTALIERYPKSDSAASAKQMRAELEGKKEETTSVASAKDLAYESAPASAAPPAAARAPEKIAATTSSDEAQITAVRASERKDETVVTVELSRRAEYLTVYDSAKRKLDIHFKDVFARAGVPENTAVNSATLANVRVKPRILGGTRVRLTLAPGAEYGIEGTGSTLTVTLRRAKPEVTPVVTPGPGVATLPATKTSSATAMSSIPATSSKTAATVTPSSTKSSSSTTTPTLSGTAQQTKRPPLKVVIDPGHGGDEKGAVGPHGIMEKDVVLAIAKRLEDALEQEQGAKVWLTRSDDDTVSLEKRYKLAKKKKPDVFISIHANASSDKKAGGIETYYLNNATDEAAKKLAVRENESWKGPRGDIDRILATMLQNALTDDSRELATTVQRALVKNVGARYKDVKNRKARSALFYVLVASPSPSVLVETSFITNPKEEQRLADPTYQQDLARSIAQGMRAYEVAARSINASL